MSEFDGHTPGPWWAEDDHGFTAIRSSSGGVCIDARNDADARLIAAAPDLLAENKRLKAQIAAESERVKRLRDQLLYLPYPLYVHPVFWTDPASLVKGV